MIKKYATLTTLLLTACGGEEVSLPSQLRNPDIFLSGKRGSHWYVLAEDEDNGCSLAYSLKKEDERNVRIYSGRECTNITLYANVKSKQKLDYIVKFGKVKGEVVEKLNLNSLRLSDEQASSIRKQYTRWSSLIKEKHIP